MPTATTTRPTGSTGHCWICTPTCIASLSLLNERRLARDTEHEHQRVSLTQLLREGQIDWHGVKPHQPDWGEHSHSIALSVRLRREQLVIYVILNAYWDALEFELPAAAQPGVPWRRWIDTALDSPADIVAWHSAEPVSSPVYRVESRSVVVLFADAAAQRLSGGMHS